MDKKQQQQKNDARLASRDLQTGGRGDAEALFRCNLSQARPGAIVEEGNLQDHRPA